MGHRHCYWRVYHGRLVSPQNDIGKPELLRGQTAGIRNKAVIGIVRKRDLSSREALDLCDIRITRDDLRRPRRTEDNRPGKHGKTCRAVDVAPGHNEGGKTESPDQHSRQHKMNEIHLAPGSWWRRRTRSRAVPLDADTDGRKQLLLRVGTWFANKLGDVGSGRQADAILRRHPRAAVVLREALAQYRSPSPEQLRRRSYRSPAAAQIPRCRSLFPFSASKSAAIALWTTYFRNFPLRWLPLKGTSPSNTPRR